MMSDLQSVLAMLTPLKPVTQLAAPSLPWTETTRVDLGVRGHVEVRHTPNLDTSDAIPVVLLHGITLTADVNFFAVAGLFGAERPAIVFDLPNHGHGIRLDHFTFDDLADDIEKILDHLRVPVAIVCGYSLGGIAGMVAANRHPGRIAGLVVQAAAMRYAVSTRERLFLTAISAVHTLGLDHATRGLPARYWRMSAARSPHAAARLTWISQELSSSGRPQLASVWKAVQSLDYRQLRKKVPTAVMILGGDRVCPPNLQRELAEKLGAHQFEIDADHDLPVADPTTYAATTEAALRWVTIEHGRA